MKFQEYRFPMVCSLLQILHDITSNQKALVYDLRHNTPFRSERCDQSTDSGGVINKIKV